MPVAIEPGVGRLRQRSTGLVVATVLIAAGSATTSLLGLLAAWPYAAETANWRLQARGQDPANLIAVGALLACLPGLSRGADRARLVWAGTLFYLAYAFTIYALSIHFGPLFLPYVAVLGLSVYACAFGLRPAAPTAVLAGRTLNLATGMIGSLAVVFALLWLSSIIAALLTGGAPAELAAAGLVANPVHVLDLALVLPGMAITALRARRGNGASQLLLGPWLVFATLMTASITIILALSSAWPPAAVVGLLTVDIGWTASRTLRRLTT